MKHVLFLCLAVMLVTATSGCLRKNKHWNNNNYLVGPACGPACHDGACGPQCADCEQYGCPTCDACGGTGYCQGNGCDACQGGGCDQCGGGPCTVCNGCGSLHHHKCYLHKVAHQNRLASMRYPANPGPPTAGVTYPYYTNRGPRDFLNPNPRGIGP